MRPMRPKYTFRDDTSVRYRRCYCPCKSDDGESSEPWVLLPSILYSPFCVVSAAYLQRCGIMRLDFRRRCWRVARAGTFSSVMSFTSSTTCVFIWLFNQADT
ncbi:hypothetical protein LX32DRAFT_146658 [Colletotrichum zoysiae]|uniref:Uncharacterized protein n=1 Tax=Colletotrichum zoysiae TaxID=1216348 RepID=A0AAD9LWJ3_9PEZI|nr:hypothetical protein LX32DRAFT_146658 [Colletotrichum zoysiae]